MSQGLENSYYEEPDVTEPDSTAVNRQADIIAGAERIRELEGKPEKYPKQYWLIFSTSQDRDRAYELMKKSEHNGLFHERLFGYSFDKLNPHGIEVDFNKADGDLRPELINFFQSRGLGVTESYISPDFPAPVRPAKIISIDSRPKPAGSAGKKAA